MSSPEIEKKTVELLNQFDLMMLPIPVEKLAAKLKLAVIPHDFGSNISGALFTQDNVSVIGVNPSESNVRRRFTIAHEIGHFMYHKNEKQTLFVDKKASIYQGHLRSEESSTGQLKKEREANTFAAALLMPMNLIKMELDKLSINCPSFSDEDLIKTLAKVFEVSTPAMTYRLTNLNYFKPY